MPPIRANSPLAGLAHLRACRQAGRGTRAVVADTGNQRLCKLVLEP